jgi:hypothetical protein
MDFSDPKRRSRYLSKIIMLVLLMAMCVVMLTQPPCHRRAPSVVNLPLISSSMHAHLEISIGFQAYHSH